MKNTGIVSEWNRNLKFKLKNDELKRFIIENLLIYHNEGDRIGYISLDNKDRIEHPGTVLIMYHHQDLLSKIDYIVRLVVYVDEP